MIHGTSYLINISENKEKFEILQELLEKNCRQLELK